MFDFDPKDVCISTSNQDGSGVASGQYVVVVVVVVVVIFY